MFLFWFGLSFFTVYYFFFSTIILQHSCCWFDILGHIHHRWCLYSPGMCSIQKLFFHVSPEGGVAVFLQQDSRGSASCYMPDLTNSSSDRVSKCSFAGRHAVCYGFLTQHSEKRNLLCWRRVPGACFVVKSSGMSFWVKAVPWRAHAGVELHIIQRNVACVLLWSWVPQGCS